MGLKKKTKVSAEFSMSSLTDIIFLLLIFFMLTSSLIIPNALNLKLPGRSTPPQTTSTERPSVIAISNAGKYTLNGSSISRSGIEKKIREIKKSQKKPSIVLSPAKKAPNEFVVAVMDMAYRHRIEAILTDPK